MKSWNVERTMFPSARDTANAVLVPWDESKPLASLTISEYDIVNRINSRDSINVRNTLLIRQTPIGVPGLYVHHEPQENDPPNVRATRLAMACGMFHFRLRGDVILSRGRHCYGLHVEEVADACCVCATFDPA